LEVGVVFEEELFFGWRDVVDEGGAADADCAATGRVSRCGRGRRRGLEIGAGLGIGGWTCAVNILKYIRQFVGRGGMLSSVCGGLEKIEARFH
jgi:hypothetical protein